MNKTKKRNLLILVTLIGLIITASLIYSLFISKKEPTIYLSSDAILKEGSNQEFYIDVKLSSFPEKSVYPGASFLISFDQTKVEFTGLKLGTMTTGNETGEKTSLSVPVWKSNSNIANKTGTISAIYLDMSANDHCYRDYGFTPETKDTLVRLTYKLLDSTRSGDTLNFTFQDAVMAAIKENGNPSLAMTDNTLEIENLTLDVQ